MNNKMSKIQIYQQLNLKTQLSRQEAQRIQNKMDTKRHTPRHIIIKMPKVKDKERILKTAREKADSYLQGSSHKTVN